VSTCFENPSVHPQEELLAGYYINNNNNNNNNMGPVA
jgi:hypothetical protein